MNSYSSDVSMIEDLAISRSVRSNSDHSSDLPFTKTSEKSNIGEKKGKNTTRTIYIVTGGSGFIGSWIVRYLLIRGDPDVYVIDCDPLPKDLIRHGVNFLQVDLAGGENDNEKFSTFLKESLTGKSTSVIIFHCAVTAMFNPRKRSSRTDEPKTNIQIAQTLIDCCLPFKDNCVIINIGDALCVRKNVSWYNPLAVGSWRRIAEEDKTNISDRKRSSYINDYSYSKAQSEKIILSSDIPCASLRPQGFVTGHLGDSFLTPVLQYNGGLLHSQGVPISLLHVEDVVRACLEVEKKVTEEKENSTKIFTICSSEMTNLSAIYNYISAKRPFQQIKIQPIIVLTVSHIIAIKNRITTFITRAPVGVTKKEDALLCGIAKSFTPARFNVLQTTQLICSNDQKSLELELNGFRLEYSTRDILDGILAEERMINEKIRGDKSK